jgi:hypothetical protein
MAGEIARALRSEATDTDRRRATAVFGYSRETKKLITRMIETNPAMEEAILKLAELAYMDGATRD